jgi:phosphohistidine phosphatase SixA
LIAYERRKEEKEMRLYLLRHGPAGNRDNWTADDYLRPLTQKGEHTMQAAAAA